MSEAGISWLSVWLLGVSLGLTACAVTCLPFIGTWAFGQVGERRLAATLGFLGGRLFAYTVLGALAGGLGAWFVKELTAGWGNLVIGISSLGAALWLVWPQPSRGCSVLKGSCSPFIMGISLTLIPCAPLATLLSTCAASGTSLHGATMGGIFGLGTLLTPMLVLIPAAGSLGQKLKQAHRWLTPWIRLGAAMVLLLLAYKRLSLAVDGVGEIALGIGSITTIYIHWWQQKRLKQAFSTTLKSIPILQG